jgi:hypothetical protein
MRREQCGAYIVTASGGRLADLAWQPRLTITRLANPVLLSKREAFPGLSPPLEPPKAATRFAPDPGRRLALERSARLRV